MVRRQPGREAARPDFPVINPRYREDWVGLSDVWLAAMGTGVVGAALEEVTAEVGGRRAIMGRPMTELAGVHFNLGRAAKELAGARAAVAHGCAEVDARIAAGVAPTEADELRLGAVSAFALEACDRAMHHLLKVVGGNGLRERHPFERRYRDFQSMPLHINAHEDRVTERSAATCSGSRSTSSDHNPERGPPMADFAVKTPPQHGPWGDFLDVWRAVDECDAFAQAWNFDHFYPLTGDTHGPCLEGWTMLSALAQATRRIRIGCMVNGMHYRHPAVTANMAATLDIISGGRLDLGMGAGWNLQESNAYGIELGSVRSASTASRRAWRSSSASCRRRSPTSRASTSRSPTPAASRSRSSSPTRRC